jgi:hypothetical protein
MKELNNPRKLAMRAEENRLTIPPHLRGRIKVGGYYSMTEYVCYHLGLLNLFSFINPPSQPSPARGRRRYFGVSSCVELKLNKT